MNYAVQVSNNLLGFQAIPLTYRTAHTFCARKRNITYTLTAYRSYHCQNRSWKLLSQVLKTSLKTLPKKKKKVFGYVSTSVLVTPENDGEIKKRVRLTCTQKWPVPVFQKQKRKNQTAIWLRKKEGKQCRQCSGLTARSGRTECLGPLHCSVISRQTFLE